MRGFDAGKGYHHGRCAAKHARSHSEMKGCCFVSVAASSCCVCKTEPAGSTCENVWCVLVTCTSTPRRCDEYDQASYKFR
eukprot:5156242-Pleurochrysis_carterae.AAC.1